MNEEKKSKEKDDVKDDIIRLWYCIEKLMFFNLVAVIIFAFIKSSHSGGIIQLNLHYLYMDYRKSTFIERLLETKTFDINYLNKDYKIVVISKLASGQVNSIFDT